MKNAPAHNSKMLIPILFRGRDYSSYLNFFQQVVPPPVVDSGTLSGRIRRGLEKHGRYEDAWLDEALYLDATDFKLKYAVRKTWIELNGERLDLLALYKGIEADCVSYATFRQRVISRPAITTELISAAATMSAKDWNTHHGRGGRRKGFTYSGDLFPNEHGTYTAITSFLKKIGRYRDRELIHSRLLRDWDLDDALCRPVIDREDSWAFVYKITQSSTGRIYVGITSRGPRTRWNEHVKSAFEKGSRQPLYIAMRETGLQDFKMEILEERSMSGHELGERETYWIERLNTKMPLGLNVASGGSIGRVEGRSVTIEGVTYQSQEAAARALSRQTGLAKHVVLSRIVKGKPLPSKARQHSQHPEAGTILYRKWLGLHKRARESATAAVASEWDNYDVWKEQTDATGKEDNTFFRPDPSRPWGRDNFAWGSAKESVTSIHGQTVHAFGRTWPSKAAACKEFGIKRNTLNLRLQAGKTLEEALSEPLGQTSRRGELFEFEGESFRSMTEAAKVLGERHGTSADKARDRIRRGVATSKWKMMGR